MSVRTKSLSNIWLPQAKPIIVIKGQVLVEYNPRRVVDLQKELDLEDAAIMDHSVSLYEASDEFTGNEEGIINCGTVYMPSKKGGKIPKHLHFDIDGEVQVEFISPACAFVAEFMGVDVCIPWNVTACILGICKHTWKRVLPETKMPWGKTIEESRPDYIPEELFAFNFGYKGRKPGSGFSFLEENRLFSTEQEYSPHRHEGNLREITGDTPTQEYINTLLWIDPVTLELKNPDGSLHDPYAVNWVEENGIWRIAA